MKTELFRKAVRIIGIALLLVFMVGSASAQTYGLKEYDMTISGSSNLHDWSMKASKAQCNAAFEVKNNQIASLGKLEFTVPVKGLKSDHDLMDTRTYDALKANKFQVITFVGTSASISGSVIKVTGNLTICGTTRQIVLVSNGVLNADKSVTVTGSHKIKMSEWNVQPPSFMFGALKVTDEVTVAFTLKLKSNQ